MAGNLHSKSNERDSIQYFQKMDSSRIDSLFAEFQKKPSFSSGGRSASRSERLLSASKTSRKRTGDLSDLLDQLKKRNPQRPTALVKPDSEAFLKSLEEEVVPEDDFLKTFAEPFPEIPIVEDLDQEPCEETTESREKAEPEKEKSESEPFQETKESLPEKVEEPVISASFASQTPESHTSFLWIVFEGVLGLLIGLGIILVIGNMNNPIEKRLVREFQRTTRGKVTYESCDKGRAPFTNSELTLKMLQASLAPQDSDSSFSVQEMDVTLAPLPQIFRNITMQTANMKGVVFPNLHTLEYQNAWRPAPIAPLFSDEIKNILGKQGESLESVRHLDSVKAKYIPIYQDISDKVKAIDEEVTEIEKKLKEFPELQVDELNAEVLKSASVKNPEILAELERMGELRKESTIIQKSWMELNRSVAKELAQMPEKIALDGKAFSTILHYAAPTADSLTEYLFKSTVEKRLEESINWGKALSQMAEMVILPKNARPVKYLKADGVIELFGQEFDFDSKWESAIDPESEVSYSGSLRLASQNIPEEMLKDAFIVTGYSEKTGMELRKISARIPLVYDSMVLGDHAALPLYTQAQRCVLVLDLTLFGDEIQGKIMMEMNQVSFESPKKEAELAGILYSQLEGKTFPKLLVTADISGSRNAPKVECFSSVVQEILPAWSAALQKIHLHAREEIVSSIFERLKNEETAFNGLLEPYYEEIIACSERTDFFRNLQSGPTQEAEVEIVPMDLAHLEVNQLDVTENIPTYNPNLGLEEPTPAVQESVAAPVGNQAEPVKPVVKSIPVKKVAEIAPIVPEEPKNDEEESKMPEASEPISVAPLTNIPDSFGNPVPNVADPVFYSNQNRSSKAPVDIPQNRKKAMPLPMSKSTSNFGS